MQIKYTYLIFSIYTSESVCVGVYKRTTITINYTKKNDSRYYSERIKDFLLITIFKYLKLGTSYSSYVGEYEHFLYL